MEIIIEARDLMFEVEKCMYTGQRLVFWKKTSTGDAFKIYIHNIEKIKDELIEHLQES